MKPMLCFKVFIGEEYEAHLMDGVKDVDETKARMAEIIIEAFERRGVKADGMKVVVTGHRGGIE